MRSGYTRSPRRCRGTSPARSRRACSESGRMMRSTDECEMSRSCHSATFSSPACRLPRSTRARPQSCSAFTGLRLCGIALEPFCAPARNGSSHLAHLGALQVADLERERLDRRADRRARVEQLGVTVAGDHLRGRHRPEPERLAHVGLDLRGRCWSRCRPRPTACRRRSASRARARRSRSRRTCSAHSASLAPKVVGSAWMPWVRPTIGAVAVLVGLGGDRGLERGDGLDHEVARLHERRPTGRCRRRRST